MPRRAPFHFRSLPLASVAACLLLAGCASNASNDTMTASSGGGFFGLFARPGPGPNDVTTPMSEYERARLLARVRSDPSQLARLNKRERYNISRIAAAATAEDEEDE